MQKPLWENNEVQFARLLSEMYGTIDFTPAQQKELCESMDLEWCDVLSLLERADTAWQAQKERTRRDEGRVPQYPPIIEDLLKRVEHLEWVGRIK